MNVKTELLRFESSPLWGYYLPVSPDVADRFIEGNDRRVICTIADRQLHVALMPNKFEYFIMMNKSLVQQLGLGIGQKLEINIEKDRSEYGMDMPDELRELLAQDEEGSKYFHELTPGKQRTLIYVVSKVKNTNSRLNKALAIVHHLKEVQGKLDFKMLNQTIKYFNNL